MANRRLLLLSNSRVHGLGYLEHAATIIQEFLGQEVKEVLFVPFAGVRVTYSDYAAMVRERFEAFGYQLKSVHELTTPNEAVQQAQAVVVGGGNTFHLLRGLYETGLLESLRARVNAGVPYIGWSAGANVACPTIKTTNDMPIVEPRSFQSFNLVPFQINPHYIDAHPEGHQGETRAERIIEFTEANPNQYVVGLREGSTLRIEDNQITLLGDKAARAFIKGKAAVDYAPGESLQFLLQ